MAREPREDQSSREILRDTFPLPYMDERDSDSDSDIESDNDDQLLIHDVPWNPWPMVDTPFFYYTDPYALSPQIQAVLHNDVPKLIQLFGEGKSPNAHDNLGNTPLHVAVIKEKDLVFNYLTQHEETRLDVQNHEGSTPLIVALVCRNKRFSRALIEGGADIRLANNEKNTPLHYSVGFDLEISRMIIEKGADLDAVNIFEQTPMFLACSLGKNEIVHMLLVHGADPTITTPEGRCAFTQALSRCEPCVQHIMYDYTFFPGTTSCNIHFLISSINSSFFFVYLVETMKSIEYTTEDLFQFSEVLATISPSQFELILKKFGGLIKDMFCKCDTMTTYIKQMTSSDAHIHFIDREDIPLCLKVLFESEIIVDIMQSWTQNCGLLHYLVNRDSDINSITELLCLMLSYGIQLYGIDLDTVYRFFGCCDLFKIMLHMDIVDDKRNIYSSLLPVMMYEMTIDIDVCLLKPNCYLFEPSLDVLVPFFALYKFKEYCLVNFSDSKEIERVRNLPVVPSLVELSRNSARKFIINKFNVKTSRQFYTILKALPICEIHRDIIALRYPLYNV